jgi:hypothetical protein
MLTDVDMLRAWELGELAGPVGRALAMLTCGFPERSSAELAGLSIGQRDALLLHLRQETFGRTLRGSAECAACGQAVVFSTICSELQVSTPPTSWPLTLYAADWVLRIRPLDSQDLAVAAATGELQAARRELLARCLISAQRGDARIAPDELPEEVYTQVVAALAEHDPQADIRLTLRCAATECGQTWQAVFDIASYFWTEVAARARRLFHEVDALARTYGWREADILAMSPVRRQQYLNLGGA